MSSATAAPHRIPEPPTGLAVLLVAALAATSLAPHVTFASAEPDTTLAPPSSREPESQAPAPASPAPSLEALAELRARVGSHAVRVWSRAEGFEVRRARFAPEGVAFAARDLRGLPRPAGGDARPLPSPIAWERIDRIEVRHSRVWLGAVVGGLLAPAWLVAATADSPDVSPGIVLTIPLSVIPGALAGSYVGALFNRSEPVWPMRPVASLRP